MDSIEFARQIAVNLPYVPNEQQALVVAALADFICAPPSQGAERVFMLNGYAGTGKTSLTGALVKALRGRRIASVLMAPTGRAAKVFAAFAGHAAFTIHRKIYRHPTLADPGAGMATQENKHTNTIFIVDEASMISGEDRASGTNLLADLIHYVYTGFNCRLILLGDTAQLPPVGCSQSPAMDPKVLTGFGLKVTHAVLTRISRQDSNSGILYNATWLRKAMKTDPLPPPRIFATEFSDVHIVPNEELIEALERAYAADGGIADTILITRSNMRAGQFNEGIRRHILYREEELSAGDLLITAKNNYFWASKVKGLPFIANGDTMEVREVYGCEIKYDMTFADVRVVLTDRPETEFDVKILLDTLHSDSATLPYERTEGLFTRIINDPERYSQYTPMSVRLRDLRQDPYYNALQTKFAYAVTCHKAQGGQWSNVFVDVGYIPEDALGLDLYRWLYTSVSRARANLYFIAPSEWMTGENH